jgi:peptidoglycan/xylan/chitin deacetylase (PgdA/CDA1 family)
MKQNSVVTREFILNLHGIGIPPAGVDSAEPLYWISKRTFVTLLDNVMGAGATSSFSIGLTFDDGNISDISTAVPELAKRRLKAGFFVCAGRIGAPHYLDPIALRDLLAAGMEIGTQGMHHRNWRELSDTLLRTEITEARQRLQDIIGTAVTKAAIPFGSYDRRVLRWLRHERLDCVYTSDRGLAQSNAWLKPRYTVDSSWKEVDYMPTLTTLPSLKARIRRRASMLYKSLR